MDCTGPYLIYWSIHPGPKYTRPMACHQTFTGTPCYAIECQIIRTYCAFVSHVNEPIPLPGGFASVALLGSHSLLPPDDESYSEAVEVVDPILVTVDEAGDADHQVEGEEGIVELDMEDEGGVDHQVEEEGVVEHQVEDEGDVEHQMEGEEGGVEQDVEDEGDVEHLVEDEEENVEHQAEDKEGDIEQDMESEALAKQQGNYDCMQY